jgi:hypothetical protein
MSFIPSPWEYPDSFTSMPKLSLEVIVDPQKWDVTEIKAKLIMGEKIKDILLPLLYFLLFIIINDSDFDLRLYQEEYLPIPHPETVQSITKYFERARNRRLIAPPFLEIDLGDNTEQKSVKFFLTKMDFRKVLHPIFESQELRYSDIDGGDAWGRSKQIEMLIGDHTKEQDGVQTLLNDLETLMVKAAGKENTDNVLELKD